MVWNLNKDILYASLEEFDSLEMQHSAAFQKYSNPL